MTVTILMALQDKQKPIPYKVFGSESSLTDKVKDIVEKFRSDIDESKIEAYGIVMVQYDNNQLNIVSSRPGVDQDFINALANISTSDYGHDGDVVDDNMIDLLKSFE